MEKLTPMPECVRRVCVSVCSSSFGSNYGRLQVLISSHVRVHVSEASSHRPSVRHPPEILSSGRRRAAALLVADGSPVRIPRGCSLIGVRTERMQEHYVTGGRLDEPKLSVDRPWMRHRCGDVR